MADDGSVSEQMPLREPPISDELEFEIPLPPVSLQANANKKRQFTAEVRDILQKRYAFIVTSDVQLEIIWSIHERLRYESDTAPDVDNILKPLLDGLSGPNGVLVDDSQVQHLSVGWIDWTSEQQRVAVRIRLNDGLWVERGHLEFVQFEGAMCWPIDNALPVAVRAVEIKAIEQMLAARNELLAETTDFYLAKRVTPVQRFFHPSRTKGFRRMSYADYLARLGR